MDKKKPPDSRGMSKTIQARRKSSKQPPLQQPKAPKRHPAFHNPLAHENVDLHPSLLKRRVMEAKTSYLPSCSYGSYTPMPPNTTPLYAVPRTIGHGYLTGNYASQYGRKLSFAPRNLSGNVPYDSYWQTRLREQLDRSLQLRAAERYDLRRTTLDTLAASQRLNIEGASQILDSIEKERLRANTMRRQKYIKHYTSYVEDCDQWWPLHMTNRASDRLVPGKFDSFPKTSRVESPPPIDKNKENLKHCKVAKICAKYACKNIVSKNNEENTKTTSKRNSNSSNDESNALHNKENEKTSARNSSDVVTIHKTADDCRKYSEITFMNEYNEKINCITLDSNEVLCEDPHETEFDHSEDIPEDTEFDQSQDMPQSTDFDHSEGMPQDTEFDHSEDMPHDTEFHSEYMSQDTEVDHKDDTVVHDTVHKETNDENPNVNVSKTQQPFRENSRANVDTRKVDKKMSRSPDIRKPDKNNHSSDSKVYVNNILKNKIKEAQRSKSTMDSTNKRKFDENTTKYNTQTPKASSDGHILDTKISVSKVYIKNTLGKEMKGALPSDSVMNSTENGKIDGITTESNNTEIPRPDSKSHFSETKTPVSNIYSKHTLGKAIKESLQSNSAINVNDTGKIGEITTESKDTKIPKPGSSSHFSETNTSSSDVNLQNTLVKEINKAVANDSAVDSTDNGKKTELNAPTTKARSSIHLSETKDSNMYVRNTLEKEIHESLRSKSAVDSNDKDITKNNVLTREMLESVLVNSGEHQTTDTQDVSEEDAKQELGIPEDPAESFHDLKTETIAEDTTAGRKNEADFGSESSDDISKEVDAIIQKGLNNDFEETKVLSKYVMNASIHKFETALSSYKPSEVFSNEYISDDIALNIERALDIYLLELTSSTYYSSDSTLITPVPSKHDFKTSQNSVAHQLSRLAHDVDSPINEKHEERHHSMPSFSTGSDFDELNPAFLEHEFPERIHTTLAFPSDTISYSQILGTRESLSSDAISLYLQHWEDSFNYVIPTPLRVSPVNSNILGEIESDIIRNKLEESTEMFAQDLDGFSSREMM